jgi:hypothetical protein
MEQEKYFQLICEAMKKLLKESGAKDILLEITAKGKFSNELLKRLGETGSFLGRGFSPDICGFYDSKPITIEVKDSQLNIQDIYQAKQYAELILAEKGFLISTIGFPIRILKFINIRPDILTYGKGMQLYVGIFSTNEKIILPSKWIPISPF